MSAFIQSQRIATHARSTALESAGPSGEHIHLGIVHVVNVAGARANARALADDGVTVGVDS